MTEAANGQDDYNATQKQVFKDWLLALGKFTKSSTNTKAPKLLEFVNLTLKSNFYEYSANPQVHETLSPLFVGRQTATIALQSNGQDISTPDGKTAIERVLLRTTSFIDEVESCAFRLMHDAENLGFTRKGAVDRRAAQLEWAIKKRRKVYGLGKS